MTYRTFFIAPMHHGSCRITFCITLASQTDSDNSVQKGKMMAKKTRKHKRTTDLPGTIYLNKNRYWWKVQLPGDDKPKARPLKPVGCRYATTDWRVAVEVARKMYQDHIYASGSAALPEQIDSIAALVAAYVQFCRGYYLEQFKLSCSVCRYMFYESLSYRTKAACIAGCRQ